MAKFSRKQLSQIKSQIKQKLLNEEKEEKKKDVVSLAEAKKIAKDMIKDDESYQNYKESKKAFRKMKRNVEAKKIQVSWNINTGDGVMYKNSEGNEIFGIVIEQRADGEYRSMNHAKWSGYVQVMSAEGKVWLSPRQIQKITD